MGRVMTELLGDPASYNAALGSATGTTVEFRDTYLSAFASMSDATLALAVNQDKLAISTARYGAGTTGAAAATMRFRQATEAMQASQLAAVSSIGRGLTMGVTVPLVAVGYEATKMALSFEQSMELVKTQAGATAAQTTYLSKGILGLVQSGQSYTQSAGSMAKAVFDIASEGIYGAKALDVLKVAAAGSAVGQADLVDTTNALTSALHVFGTTSTGIDGVMATLNATVGQGKLHLEDLTSALGTKLILEAKTFGLTLAQTGAAIDIFTKSGYGASQAATTIAMGVLRMADPTAAGVKALANLGLGATQLASELKSGGLPEALQTLTTHYNDLVKAGQGIQAEQDIFNAFGGSRGGASVLTLVTQYSDYMKTLGTIQKQSSPATFWAAVSSEMQQPDAKIHEDLARMGADMVTLGLKLAPLEADVVGGFTSMVTAVEKLPGPAKDALEILAVGLGTAGPIMWGGTKVVGMFKDLKTAVTAIGDAAGWVATKMTASAATTDAAQASMQASATKTATSVESIGLAETELTGQDALMAAKFEGAMVEMQAGAATTDVAVKGIGASMLGLLGPIALVAAAMYELDQHQKQISSWAQSLTTSLGGAGSAHQTPAQIIAGVQAGSLTQSDLTALKSFGLSAAAYAAGEHALAAQTLGPARPTTAQARNAIGASLGGKGTLQLADVLSAIGMGLVTSTWLSANRDRFANTSDYDAAMKLLSPRTTSPTASSGAATANGPLTLQQQLTLDPTNATLLDKVAAQDKVTLAWLAKRRAEGKISNTAYVGEAAPLEAQVQADTTKATTSTDKAAAAITKAQAEAEKTAATRQNILKSRLTAATPAGSGATAVTPGQATAYDALEAFYKSEASNAALSSEQRSRYMELATAARAKEQADAIRDATQYELTVTRDDKALVDKAKTLATETRNLLPEEAALQNLIAAAQAAAANPNLTPAKQATYSQLAATSQQQLATLRNEYQEPLGLSLQYAQAQATAPGLGQETDIEELNVLKAMKAAAEKAFHSTELSDVGKLAALNEIVTLNSQIANALGTGSIGRITHPSAETFSAGLHLTAAQRDLLAERYAQAMAGGGSVAGYRGVQGLADPGTQPFAVPIHHTTIVKLDGQVIATSTTMHQVKTERNRAVQTRGPHAGR